MNDLAQPLVFHPPRADSELARRLRSEVQGEVMFDRATRGRYSTDASIYQVEPIGVLIPRTQEDVRAGGVDPALAALRKPRHHVVFGGFFQG